MIVKDPLYSINVSTKTHILHLFELRRENPI